MEFCDDALLDQVKVLSLQISNSFAKHNGFNEQRTVDSKANTESKPDTSFWAILISILKLSFLFDILSSIAEAV